MRKAGMEHRGDVPYRLFKYDIIFLFYKMLITIFTKIVINIL